MCGINGVLNFHGDVNKYTIDSMNKAISNRGPDDNGSAFFSIANKTLALGHTRLSIIDLSSHAHQPMQIQNGKYSIVFNGEIFNYQELKKDLQNSGEQFFSNSDTEVLIRLYAKYGKACLEKLRGFFAFCIFDKEKNTLFLARDRLGVKPLKYYYDGKYFAFSSEIKALLNLYFIDKVADITAISDFLLLKYIPAPKTIIQGIKKLPAGHFLEVDIAKHTINIESYWHPQFEPKLNLSYEDAYSQTIDLLKDAVKYRMVSDVPVGVFLSGGIDSSVVVSIIREFYSGDLKTFCVGFNDKRFDESEYANIVANQFETNHSTFMIDEADIKNEIENIICNYDEPFADPSIIPTYYVSKFASQSVKVVLGGDGGDELFGGYKRYKIHKRNLWLNAKPKFVNNFFADWLQNEDANINKKSIQAKFTKALEELSSDYLGSYALRFGGFTSKIRAKLLEQDKIPEKWSRFILNELSKCHASSSVDKLMALDQLTFLPEYILTKTDIATMSNSLEGREPLLDHKLVEFVNKLPKDYKYGENGKRILKQYLKDKLPQDLVNRKKAGFNPPMDTWSKGILKDFMEHHIIERNSTIAWLNNELRVTLWQNHICGKANNSEQVWLLSVLGCWLERYKIRIK